MIGQLGGGKTVCQLCLLASLVGEKWGRERLKMPGNCFRIPQQGKDQGQSRVYQPLIGLGNLLFGKKKSESDKSLFL
jgi:hypothetical protein